MKNFFFVKLNSKVIKLKFEEVVFIEGLKNYAKIHTLSGSFLTLTSMKQLENFLPPEEFIRIHKSYIIAVNHINQMTKSEVCIEDRKCLPVGETFRGKLRAFVDGNMI